MTEPLNLDALAALEAAATPGPWAVDDRRLNVVKVPGDFDWVGQVSNRPRDKWCADAEFIAAARNALPALVERVRVAEDALAKSGCSTVGPAHRWGDRPCWCPFTEDDHVEPPTEVMARHMARLKVAEARIAAVEALRQRWLLDYHNTSDARIRSECANDLGAALEVQP